MRAAGTYDRRDVSGFGADHCSAALSTLKELVSEGLGVLLVEQFAHLALSYGDTAYVMSGGRIVLKEECKSLIKTPERLHEAYLF